MQEQGNLHCLWTVSLALFKIFAYYHETTINSSFCGSSRPIRVWILDTTGNCQQICKTIQLFLVASNITHRINEQFPGAWRVGPRSRSHAVSDLYRQSKLCSHSHGLRDQLPVLETRLDADDGLHVQFCNKCRMKRWTNGM
jgi:hypothetical protein